MTKLGKTCGRILEGDFKKRYFKKNDKKKSIFKSI